MRILLVSEDRNSPDSPLFRIMAAQGMAFRNVALAEFRNERGSRLARKVRRYLPGAAVTQPIADAVEEFRPDIIHLDSRRAVALALVMALRGRTDIPVVLEHGAIGGLNVLSPFDWMTYFNRRITKLVVPSRAIVNNWLGNPLLRRCISARRCAVLPLSFNLPAPLAARDRAALREKYGFGPDVLVVGTVCNIRPVKNLAFVAEIIRQLDANIVFALVGAVRDEDEFARIKRAGGDKLRFLGPIPDAQTMMAAFDLYVTPTRPGGEGFGAAQAEAMSNGVPVLAMNFGGCADTFENGVSGLALPAESSHWKQAITALAADPERRERMGAAARARVATRFSLEAIAAERIDLYRAVIAEAGPAIAAKP